MNTIQSSFKNSIYSYNKLHSNISVESPNFAQIQQSFVSVPSFAYKANFAPNISFKGVDKVDENLYSDTDKFAEYFEQKLKTKMCVKSEGDVQNIIDNVVKATDTDEKTVCSVISRLTQFSDYSHLEDLENNLRNLGFKFVYNDCNKLTLNAPFRYLSNKEQFLGSFLSLGVDTVFFIDNDYLNYCESLDDESEKFFLEKHNLDEAVIIDGWNRKGISQTLFGSDCDLETATINAINEMKSTGKNLDEVLNDDILQRCKDIFGEEYASKIRVVKSKKQPQKNAKEIAQHLQPKMPNKKQIAKFVDVISDNIELVAEDMSKAEKEQVVCRYLDETFEPYSVERMNVALKDIHNQIKEKVDSLGKDMDDVVYIVPNFSKSFSLISYQYAKVNNIPLNKFDYENFEPFVTSLDKKPVEKDKVYVILDDVAGTGESLASNLKYKNFTSLIFNDKNTNLIFAPLYMTDLAQYRFDFKAEDYDRKNVDFYVTNKKFDSQKYMIDFLKDKMRANVVNIVGGEGYRSVATSVMFPFCITDTNSRLSSLFSTFFVRFPNRKNIMQGINSNWKYKDSFVPMAKDIGTFNEDK